MKKCAKCGGAMYKTGGSTMKTTVGSASPKGLIFGIPNAGSTGPNKQGMDSMKKGGPIKKPLPKAQFGYGSGPLGLPNFEERQKRKIARAERKAEVANIQGYDNVANKRNTRSSNASKILGTGRSKARTMINSGNNAGNTIDSYNKDSYNRGNSNGRPQSIMQSQPTGFTSPEINPEPTPMIPGNGQPEFTSGSMNNRIGSREFKKGGTTKAAKFAALAPPYNKATAADRIAGAKMSKKKLGGATKKKC